MKRVAFVGSIVAATLTLNLIVLRSAVPDFLGVDFAVFARTLTWTPHELYSDTGHTPFIYPPTAILPFKLLSLMPYAAVAVLSGLVFFFAVSAVCDRKVAALSLLGKAAFKGLQLGQIPMLLAAGLFAALLLNPFAGGLLWGFIATIKPQLMIFAPVALFVRKDKEMLGGMMAGAGISFVTSLLTVGPEAWAYWFASVSAFTETRLLEGGAIWAITPGGVAAASGYPALPFMLLGGFIGTMAVVLSAKRVRDAELIALIVAASLAISPYGYIHDAIAIIPACVILMLRGRWAFAVPAALIFFGTPVLAMSGLLGLLLMFAWQGIEHVKPPVAALRGVH